MGWVARIGVGVAVAAVVVAGCGSSLGARTFEVVAPAVQQVQAFPVTVTDRSGRLIDVRVDMVAVADKNGFTRDDRARNIVGRADQVALMWPGGGCQDRGSVEVAADVAGRLRFRLDRASARCAIAVMDRVLLTFAQPVDASKIDVEHVEPNLQDDAPPA